MKRIPMFILLAVITCPIVNGGEQDIKKKERALEQLRKEIDAYEQRIEQSEKKEKVTLSRDLGRHSRKQQGLCAVSSVA